MSPGTTTSAKHLTPRNYTNSATVSGGDGLIEDSIPIITARSTGRGGLWLRILFKWHAGGVQNIQTWEQLARIASGCDSPARGRHLMEENRPSPWRVPIRASRWCENSATRDERNGWASGAARRGSCRVRACCDVPFCCVDSAAR